MVGGTCQERNRMSCVEVVAGESSGWEVVNKDKPKKLLSNGHLSLR